MNANIQYSESSINQDAEKLLLEKLDSLSKKYDWIVYADVFFKEEKATYGKGKICEVRLSVPGPRIFASSNKPFFEAAIAETVKDLDRQLHKKKDEMNRKR